MTTGRLPARTLACPHAHVATQGADIKVIEGPRREGDPAKVYADASKVKTELNWQPRFTNLDESLRTAWRWSKQAKY